MPIHASTIVRDGRSPTTIDSHVSKLKEDSVNRVHGLEDRFLDGEESVRREVRTSEFPEFTLVPDEIREPLLHSLNGLDVDTQAPEALRKSQGRDCALSVVR